MAEPIDILNIRPPEGAGAVSEAPRSKLSMSEIEQPGRDMAAAFAKVGAGLNEASGALEKGAVTAAERQAYGDLAKQKVTRDPQGNIQVLNPANSFFWGEAGREYERIVRQGTSAGVANQLNASMVEAAIRNPYDANKFKADTDARIDQVQKDFGNTPWGAEAVLHGRERQTQHYENILNRSATLDVENQKKSILDNIDDLTNTMIGLARQKGVDSPEFKSAMNNYVKAENGLVADPRFKYPQASADLDIKQTTAKMQGEALAQHVDDTFNKKGKSEAQKILMSQIWENKDLKDSDRTRLYNQGMSRLAFLSQDENAQFQADGQQIKDLNAGLARGTIKPDDPIVKEARDRFERNHSVDAIHKLDLLLQTYPHVQAVQSAPGGASESDATYYGRIPKAADPYALIPPKGEHGEDQISRFRQWNSDPVGNSARNLATVHPDLQAIVRRAQADNPSLPFIVALGKSTPAQEQLAQSWGWSPKGGGNHQGGNTVDLWPLDKDGHVVFDKDKQTQINQAMQKAAGELDRSVKWGGLTSEGGANHSFRDAPNFELLNPRERNEPSIAARSAGPIEANSIDGLKAGIARIESGGNYGAQGPITQNGDRAYGKYQVMGKNVGPWTKEILGQEMTPLEFLHNPEAQEKVATAKLTQYVSTAGNYADAASMWFSGKTLAEGGAAAKDINGMSGARYAALAAGSGPSGQRLTPEAIDAMPWLLTEAISAQANDTEDKSAHLSALVSAMNETVKGGNPPPADTLAMVMQAGERDPQKYGMIAAEAAGVKLAAMATGGPGGGPMPAPQREAYEQALQSQISGADIYHQKMLNTALDLLHAQDQHAKDAPLTAYAQRFGQPAPPPIDPSQPDTIPSVLAARGVLAQHIGALNGAAAPPILEQGDMAKLQGALQGQQGGQVLSGIMAQVRPEDVTRLVGQPEFRSAVAAMTRSDDPAKVNSAFGFLDKIKRDNPQNFEPFGRDVSRDLSMWQGLAAYMTPQAAIEYMRKSYDPAEEGARKKLDEQADANLKSWTPDAVLKAVSGASSIPIYGRFTGASAPVNAVGDTSAPATMANEWAQNYKFMFRSTADDKLSQAYANERVNTAWGTSAVSNGAYMKRPPERYYPPVGGSYDWMKGQLDTEAKAYGDSVGKPITVAVTLAADQRTDADIANHQPPTYRVIAQAADGWHALPNRFVFDPRQAGANAMEQWERQRAAQPSSGMGTTNEIGVQQLPMGLPGSLPPSDVGTTIAPYR